MILLISLLAVCFLLYLVITGIVRKPQNINFTCHIKQIAHRVGFKNIAVENSTAAIIGALKKNIKYFEIDIQLTKDNKLISFHDEDLLRLAGIDKKITNLTLEELKSIKLKQENFEANIEEIEEILLLQKKHKFCLFLDVKPAISNNKKYVTQIYKLLVKHELIELTCITSFSPAILLYFRLLDKNLTLSQSVEMTSSNCLTIFYYHIITSLLPHILGLNFLLIQNDLCSINFVKKAAQNNIQVLVWTINDKSEKKYLEKHQIGYLTDIL